jgi:hypothetical protein
MPSAATLKCASPTASKRRETRRSALAAASAARFGGAASRVVRSASRESTLSRQEGGATRYCQHLWQRPANGVVSIAKSVFDRYQF